MGSDDCVRDAVFGRQHVLLVSTCFLYPFSTDLEMNVRFGRLRYVSTQLSNLAPEAKIPALTSQNYQWRLMIAVAKSITQLRRCTTPRIPDRSNMGKTPDVEGRVWSMDVQN